MNKGITINRIFAYIISFLLLLDGSNMWQLTGSAPRAMDAKFILVLVSLMSVVATLSIKKVQLSIHFLRNMTLISLLFLVYWLMTRYNFIYFFRIQYLVFMSFAVYLYIQFKYNLIADVIKAFINIWLVISIITTFFWLFGSVLNIVPLRLTYYNWIGTPLRTYTFYNLYFANPVQNIRLLGESFFRNTGIYAESPGAANYFLYSVALELSFLVNTKGHKKRLIIFLLTGLTTFSTKVFVAYPIMFFLSYVFREKKRQQHEVIQIFKYLLVIVFGALVAYAIFNILEDKSSTGSYRVRLDDVYTMFGVFLDKPIFGTGFGNTEEIISRFTVSRNNDGLSMGLFVMLAQGGLWITSMYLAPLYLSITRFWKQSNYRRFIIFGIGVLINLVISNVMQSSGFLFILAAGYAYFNMTETEKQNLLISGLNNW